MKIKTFEEILKEVDPIISYYSYIVSNGTMSYEYKDAKQEITIRVWKSFSQYNPNKGAVKTFFVRVIRNHMKKMFKDDKRPGRQIDVDTLKLYSPVGRSGESDSKLFIEVISDARPEYDLIESIDTNDALDYVESRIKGKAKEIFVLARYKGIKNVSVISKITGLSRQRICNLIRRRIRPVFLKIL